jgi:hypothetical protein
MQESSAAKEKAMKTVPVNDSFMALLNEYSHKTGVPITRCVSDALFDWLANVAPVTLERLGLAPLNMPYISRYIKSSEEKSEPVSAIIGRS